MQKARTHHGRGDALRAEIHRLNTDGSLPPGVQVDAFYDRGDLVAITVGTGCTILPSASRSSS